MTLDGRFWRFWTATLLANLGDGIGMAAFPLLAALKSVGFTGPTEIFMHPTPRGIPIMPTLAESTAEILRAKQHLDSIVAKL